MARDLKLIKVCLENRGEDSETPWAQDLGPAKSGDKGSRRVRLVNVPFLHAKPTWGDVIVVSPLEDGRLTWDANGVPWSKIGTRIEEDGGRYAMIIDYAPHDPSDGGSAAFKAVYKACEDGNTDLQKAPMVCEGAFGPADGRPGRAYLAVKDALEPAEVMKRLRDARPPCDLIQIHPESKPKKPAARKPAAKKAMAKKPAAKKAMAKKPAAKKPAKKPARKAAAKKSAAKTHFRGNAKSAKRPK
ncbi:MAG: hypothetical protein H0T89_01575 [Deltaproteobacteria bacterium]|nr:hypothetical protein [Deltaproteobacteria bacterium]MDQ3301265.1 hypothetical protein [Myxococcota bacterium]